MASHALDRRKGQGHHSWHFRESQQREISPNDDDSTLDLTSAGSNPAGNEQVQLGQGPPPRPGSKALPRKKPPGQTIHSTWHPKELASSMASVPRAKEKQQSQSRSRSFLVRPGSRRLRVRRSKRKEEGEEEVDEEEETEDVCGEAWRKIVLNHSYIPAEVPGTKPSTLNKADEKQHPPSTSGSQLPGEKKDSLHDSDKFGAGSQTSHRLVSKSRLTSAGWLGSFSQKHRQLSETLGERGLESLDSESIQVQEASTSTKSKRRAIYQTSFGGADHDYLSSSAGVARSSMGCLPLSDMYLHSQSLFTEDCAARSTRDLQGDEGTSAEEEESHDGTSLTETGRTRRRGRRDGWGESRWWFGSVVDPRTPWMRGWIRLVSMTQVFTLAIYPCFLYAPVYDGSYSCLYLQGKYAAVLSGLLSFCDALLLVQTYLTLRMAFVPLRAAGLSQVELETNAKEIARFNLSLLHGIWLDLVTFLPIAQVYLLVVGPYLVQHSPATYKDATGGIITCFALLLLQYLVRLAYVARFYTRWQRVLGYIFSTAWLGFVLNLAGYLTCAHGFGALWYLVTVSSVSECYQEVCLQAGTSTCDPTWITCPVGLAFEGQTLSDANIAWASNVTLLTTCFQPGGSFDFGIYSTGVTLTVVSQPLVRIVYGNFFGLMTISSFGNALVPSSKFGETLFCIVMIISGLLLFTLLIGNIQIFLHSVTAQVEAMQLRREDLTFWMKSRRLPEDIRKQIMRQERESFLITRGIDEDELLQRLPRMLRRDIKRQICISLVKKVPLFGALDDCVLDSLCERLEPRAYCEDIMLVRQGEPVERMVFLVRGRLLTHHRMDSVETVCQVDEGNFTGEELLSWGLSSTPDYGHLPLASATLTTLTIVEAFVLSAEDIAFITSHFKFNLRSKKLRDWIRYFSPSWRAWAALQIQICWRRYKARQRFLAKQQSMGTPREHPDSRQTRAWRGGDGGNPSDTAREAHRRQRTGTDEEGTGEARPLPGDPSESHEDSSVLGFYTNMLRMHKPETHVGPGPSMPTSRIVHLEGTQSPPPEDYLGQGGLV